MMAVIGYIMAGIAINFGSHWRAIISTIQHDCDSDALFAQIQIEKQVLANDNSARIFDSPTAF
jgi:hypothetical protein